MAYTPVLTCFSIVVVAVVVVMAVVEISLCGISHATCASVSSSSHASLLRKFVLLGACIGMQEKSGTIVIGFKKTSCKSHQGAFGTDKMYTKSTVCNNVRNIEMPSRVLTSHYIVRYRTNVYT